MADKAPPNKGGTCSGVGSNMSKDDSTCQAVRSISQKNHPTGTKDTQTAIRSVSKQSGPNTKLK